MVPIGMNIPMYESERIRSDYFPTTRYSDKHRILDGIPLNFFKSLKTFSERFQMVQTYPSMSLRTVVNVIKLILHNLENTEFLTEFRIIYSLILLTRSTPQFGFQSAVALFCVNLRNIGVLLYLK